MRNKDKSNTKFYNSIYIAISVIFLIKAIIFLYMLLQLKKYKLNLQLDWKNYEFKKMYVIICIIGFIVSVVFFLISLLALWKYKKNNHSELLQNVYCI